MVRLSVLLLSFSVVTPVGDAWGRASALVAPRSASPGTPLGAMVPSSSRSMVLAYNLASEGPGADIEDLRSLHAGLDGAAAVPGTVSVLEAEARGKPTGAFPAPAARDVRSKSASVPVKGDRGSRSSEASETDSTWLIPTLGGAGLFVAGLILAASAATAGSALALIGLILLVYGLVWGVKEHGGTVNGHPVG